MRMTVAERDTRGMVTRWAQRVSRALLTWTVEAGIVLAVVTVATLARRGFGSEATRVVPEPVSAETLGARTARTIAALQARLREQPEAARYAELGFAYLERARETANPSYFTRAEEVLRAALQLDSNNSDAFSAMGVLSVARHEFREALVWAGRARQANPYDATNDAVLADANTELGYYAAAVEATQAMINRRPGLASYARVAHARELHGDRHGALDAMQRAVTAGAPGSEAIAWAHVQLGDLYFRGGSLQAAATEYERALGHVPGYLPALAAHARILAAAGDISAAIAQYERVVNAMPRPEYAIALGDLYEVQGRDAGAAEQYDLVWATFQLLQDNGVAIELEVASFIADHSARYDTGVALERARQAYLTRPNIYSADVLAWALFQAHQYEEAYAYSNEALRLGTKDVAFLFHRALIAQRLGRDAEAETLLVQVLDLNPYFSVRFAPIARQALEQLREGRIRQFDIGGAGVAS